MHIDVTTTISLKSDQGYELMRYTGKGRSLTFEGSEQITEAAKNNMITKVKVAIQLAKDRSLSGFEGFIRSLSA